MSLRNLFMACGDMTLESSFFISEVGTSVCTSFNSWDEIPEEMKNAEVFGFSFYKCAEWCIVIK